MQEVFDVGHIVCIVDAYVLLQEVFYVGHMVCVVDISEGGVNCELVKTLALPSGEYTTPAGKLRGWLIHFSPKESTSGFQNGCVIDVQGFKILIPAGLIDVQ